jgi:hypothetical protein
MINQHWNRWIFASASSFFKQKIVGYPFFIEGQNAPLQGDSIEFRLTGPEWTQISPNTYIGEIVINILVKAVKEEDAHKIFRMVGLTEAAFVVCFPVKKYGNTVNVDNSNIVIGFMNLEQAGGKDIRTTHFGQLVPEVPSIQSTVEANYKITLIN